ncbi:870_t:CDS:2 [Funneliformis geosporum]|nr:870_t:CDS:2 [Funneliformis geosporum]
MTRRTSLQVQYDQSTKFTQVLLTARKLIRNNGIPGLWIGFIGTLAFRTWLGFLGGSYEVYSGWLRRHNMNEMIPFDSVKNRTGCKTFTFPKSA